MRYVIVLAILALGSIQGVYAHTVDSVGPYRLEIGWMNEPVISRETNGIELHISYLEPCPDMDSIECADLQHFGEGVGGLEKELRLELVYMDENIILPLIEDHNIPGKYHAFVNPTISGFYQVNLIGDIEGTPVSISMHPPKVSERSSIEFPEPEDLTVTQIIDGHTALIEEVGILKAELDDQQSASEVADWVMVVFVIGISLGISLIVHSRYSLR